MRWLIACVLAVSSSFASADGPLYGDVQVAAAGVRHSDLDFVPIFGSLGVGVFVMPGIGVEIFGDTVLAPYKKKGFELEIEQAYGIAARFQSPPVGGVQGYIVLGAVNYTVNQQAQATASLGGSTVSGDFTGVRASLGILQRLRRFPNLSVSAEFRHYNAGEPLRVDALMLGLRVNTP